MSNAIPDGLETAPEFPLSQTDLGHQLRTHAYQEAAARGLAGEPARLTIDVLWAMADAVDGGTGDLVHLGCPDPSIPTRNCQECHITVDVETGLGARRPTVFTTPEQTGPDAAQS